MCQSGLCKYEKGCGENAGDCTLDFASSFPGDAYCIIRDKEIDDVYFLRNEEIDEYLIKFPPIKFSKKREDFES
jgi:hypothetical protein